MTEPAGEMEVRQALWDLQRYLSDQVAPLMVTDSVEVLLRCPHKATASAIEGWVGAQYRGQSGGIPVSDFLFHALKKIQLMSDLKLIDQEPLSKYLMQLGDALVGLCPAEEREAFMANLSRLGQTEAELAPGLTMVHRQGGPQGTSGRVATAGAAAPGGITEEVTRGLRRFAYLVERLEREATPTDSGKGGARGDLMTQILATAAVNSRTDSEFEQYMSRLSKLGIDTKTDQVFRALGRGLPGWTLPAGAVPDGPAPQHKSVEAMHRLVTTAADPAEALQRFSDLVTTAVEQFNEGNLTQCVTMLELAQRIIKEGKLDVEGVKAILSRAPESLAAEVLRKHAERAEKHATLKKVLEFFPTLRPEGLLAALENEEKRDRRKLILAMLEAHGEATREAVLQRLDTFLANGSPDVKGYFLRNLVFLLRRIPRPAEADQEREVALLAQVTNWGTPVLAVKEAIATLGQMKIRSAEQVLIARLQEFEGLLLVEGGLPSGAEDLRVVLDRLASTLARSGSPNASRTVVNHALTRQPALGDTMARLADLGSVDLSADTELVELLTGTLRHELPKKVLGFVVNKKNDNVTHLIQSVAGTPSAAVREVLEEIVSRFADQEFAKVASKTLAAFGAPPKPPEPPGMSLAGDLELFGLPNLLQTLSDSRMTGTLALTGKESEVMAMMAFDTGKIRGCKAGALEGEIAVYQLFERPMPGKFVFKSQKEAAPIPGGETEPLEVLPTVLEALRRHDEFQQAKSLVPDDATLKPTGVKPTRPPGEDDPA
ncbi:MAG TPA: DUF4388 domain-containing protein, partial [Candidatus Polarisedimenticolia bacterium]|nr:DUF4388 domain-containing protein [Candidatus Polarisedimenticolia bacterium]